MSVQTDSDQIVSAWERASKQLLQDEKKLKRLHAAAIAHTCFMPPQLGNRWIEFLNELEKIHAETLQAAEKFVSLEKEIISSGRPRFRPKPDPGLRDLRPLRHPPWKEGQKLPEMASELAHEKFEERCEKLSSILAKTSIESDGLQTIIDTPSAKPLSEEAVEPDVPNWKKGVRELWHQGKLVKRFSRNSNTNQEKLLDCFQEANWEETITSPLQKRQTSATIQAFNDNLEEGSAFYLHAIGNRLIRWSIRLMP